LSIANMINDGKKMFEAESFNASAHFVQIFEIFVAAFIKFATLAFELINNFLVASEVGASVGVSNQVQHIL